jgi:hypothetical protein
MAQHFRNNPRYWRTPLMPQAELLTAEYYAQEFSPHWHETFSIPVTRMEGFGVSDADRPLPL